MSLFPTRMIGLLVLMAASLVAAAPTSSDVGVPPKNTLEAERPTGYSGLPTLRLGDTDGVVRDLGEWRGQVLLLNFWATWCTPCQAEIRSLLRRQHRLAGRGLQVVGVGVDTARKLRNAARTLGIDYPVLVADPARDMGLLSGWGNPGGVVPYNVIIDRVGSVRLARPGVLDADAFDAFILPLLAPEPASESVK